MKRIQASIIAGLLLFTLILPQFVLAQVISDVDAVDITATTAAITWTTNNLSDSEVKYGTTTQLLNTESDLSMVFDHYVPLTGLDPDTLYYYAVWSDGVRSPADPNEYHSFTTTKLPEEYSISLDHACGVCGELVEAGVCGEIIEVTAIVAASGTYHICWDSRTEANVVATFTAGGAGIYTVAFFMPEATKGSHNVYLVNNTYTDPATNTFATFEVLPSVQTDLSVGPVGTEVTLDGYGFSNGQDIRVTLYQGGAKKGEEKTTDANGSGSWTVLYTIPDTPAGGYILKIESKEGTIWVGWVNKDFEVTPQITTSTDAGTVGQTIEVNGTGFASEEEDIEITFDGEVVQTNNPVVADDNGSWEAILRIPSLQ
ncbi:MAG: fibronectin type III domain-containing protein, partial [Candidatus Thorarchaeota archaeon]